jgi:hypothetical protein
MVLLFTLALTGCTHTTPYFGDAGDSPSLIQGHEDQVKQRLLLVGDTGEPKMTGCGSREVCEPVLDLMEHWAKKRAGGRKPFILFLGDNIYPGGLPDETIARKRLRAEAKLNAQNRVLINAETRGTFIPGNHDWGGTFGKYHEIWVRQYEFLKQAEKQQEAKYGQSYLLVPELESGCPWPVRIGENELEGVTLIVLDSQWWLTSDEMEEVGSCRRTSAEAIADAQARVVAELTEMLKAAGESQVIVATHHPMASHGVHGGWLRHFSQDIRGSRFQTMIKSIQKAYHDSGAQPLIHAAGHDHALQVLKGADESSAGNAAAQYNLVSGAGSKAKLQSVWHGDDTLFAHQSTGFMVIDFMQNGEVFLQVIEPDGSDDSGPDGKRVYTTQLK